MSRKININGISINIFQVEANEPKAPLFCFHHGAGHTLQTWIPVVNLLKTMMDCHILIFDCRGHGATISDCNISLEQLSLDMTELLNVLYPEFPPTILVGHRLIKNFNLVWVER